MKRYWFSALIFLIAIGTACLSEQWWPAGQQRDKFESPVVIDEQPIERNRYPFTSLAGVITNVTPSVVNIFSTRSVKLDPNDHPFLNDPLVKRFFGLEDDERTGSPTLQQQGLGSGVVITKDGYILTSNHVVEGADEIQVTFANEVEYPARIIGSDPKTDVALLKIEASDLPAITFADSSQIEIGDLVIAVGNPFGVGQAVTMGIVSAVGRGDIGIVDYEDFIQTDASINPGNSGGALVDAYGRLIGINTAIASQSGGSQGIGFAIPVNLARGVVEQVLQHGRVIRGYLGVNIQALTPDLAEEFELPGARGVIINDLLPNGPAAGAGIQPGDIVVEFNQNEIEGPRQFRLKVAQTFPGSRVPLKLIRNGRPIEVQATLGELPGSENAMVLPPGFEKSTNESPVAAFSGVQIQDLTERFRKQLNTPPGLRGVVIVSVIPGSPAHMGGLKTGDVITEFAREKVNTSRELWSINKRTRDDSILLKIWQEGASRYAVLKAR